jgi:hypothetical protein
MIINLFSDKIKLLFDRFNSISQNLYGIVFFSSKKTFFDQKNFTKIIDRFDNLWSVTHTHELLLFRLIHPQIQRIFLFTFIMFHFRIWMTIYRHILYQIKSNIYSSSETYLSNVNNKRNQQNVLPTFDIVQWVRI